MIMANEDNTVRKVELHDRFAAVGATQGRDQQRVRRGYCTPCAELLCPANLLCVTELASFSGDVTFLEICKKKG